MIYVIIALLCTIALSLTGSLTFFVPTQWYEFYKPLVLAIGGFVFGFLLDVFLLWFNGAVVPKKNRTKISKWARFWFTQGLWLVRKFSHIKVIWKGLEKIPNDRRFVLVANHKSNFDSLIISEKLYKYDIAFISKEANNHLPLGIPNYIQALLYLFINRDDMIQSLNIMKTATEYIKENKCSIGVFPEGQRNFEDGLLDFHEGCFNIAIKSEAPIVVMAINNTRAIKKNFPWKKTVVEYEVLSVIYPEDYIGQGAKQVSELAKEYIKNSLKA